MGPSLTSRGLAGRAGLVVRDLVGRVDLVVLVRVGLADQDLDRGQAGPVDRAVLGRVDLAVLHPVDLADIRDLADRVARAGLVVLVALDLEGREDPAGLGPAGRAVLDPAGREDLGDQGMDRVDPAGLLDLVVLDLAGREDLGDQGMDRVDPADLVDPAGRADLVGRVDRHRRRTRPGALTSGVAPRWAAPGMRLTASARPTTVRRLHPHNTDSAGMVGLHPERRHLSGTGRRLRVAGAVHRLPVVGTAHGTVRRVT
jgi:hypothetical protein